MAISPRPLEGQSVVVTGGGRGYGECMSLAVARAGARVVVASRSADESAHVARRVAAEGGTAIAVSCDVTDEESLRRLLAAADEAFGAVDVLVSNAGHPGSVADPLDIDADDWDRTFAVNVRGSFLGAKLVLPGMIARGRGTIVNVTSATAVPNYPYVRSVPYTVSKFAVDGLTNILANRYRDRGVLVYGFSPGLSPTRFLDGAPAGYLSGRTVQTPEHVMEPIVHLLTSGLPTGRVLDVREWLREQGLFDKYSYVHA